MGLVCSDGIPYLFADTAVVDPKFTNWKHVHNW